MTELLDQLLQEENELQFVSFDETTAWRLGSQMVERAQRERLPIVIDILRGSHQLFHAGLSGSSADNDEWVKRKTRTVYRFEHSSFYIGQLLKSKGKTIEESYLVPENEFAAHGGSFPIIVKGTGVIGAITVSGLPQEEDHRVVVEGIRNYLASQK